MLNLYVHIRIKDWWHFIAAPVMAFYIVAISYQPLPTNYKSILVPFFAFLGLTISTAAFGFFINEWSDIQDDITAKKENKLATLSLFHKILILLTILLLMSVAVIFIVWNKKSILFFSLQLCLFLLYSLTPFRLKRYKFIALIIDALYSGTLFYLLAIALFTDDNNPFLYSAIFIWALSKGLRNFLLHLLNDAPFDRQLEFKTIATHYSPEEINYILKRYLFPIEMISYLFFLTLLPYNYVFIFSFAIFFIYIYKRPIYIFPFLIKRQCPIATHFISEINLYYELFFILVGCIVLMLIAIKYWILLLVILFLFPKIFLWLIGIFYK